MFYVKEKLGDTSEIRVPICENNVFTICPICGAEVDIDLLDITKDEAFDVEGTSVLCSECSKKVLEGTLDVD